MGHYWTQDPEKSLYGEVHKVHCEDDEHCAQLGNMHFKQIILTLSA